MNSLIPYFLALFLTILTEFVVYWVFIRNEPLKLFLYSVLINSLTLPVANYIYHDVIENFLLIELLVILLESLLILILFKQKYSKSITISFFANVITAAMSLIFL